MISNMKSRRLIVRPLSHMTHHGRVFFYFFFAYPQNRLVQRQRKKPTTFIQYFDGTDSKTNGEKKTLYMTKQITIQYNCNF